MRVLLWLEEPDLDAVYELREWLQDNELVRRYGRLRWAEASDDEPAGVGLSALNLVVGSGLPLVQLAMAVRGWRYDRPDAPAVLISRPGGAGGALRVDTGDTDALREAVTLFERSG